MSVVVIAEAPEGSPARYAEDRPGNPTVLHDLDLGHPSLDPLLGIDVVVTLDEVHLAVRPRPADAVEVHDLIALGGRPTALVLPATYLHDDIHRSNLCVGPMRAGQPRRRRLE